MPERKTYILIEDASGARALVKSLDGHEECKIIKDRVPESPSPHHHLSPETHVWVEDKAAKDRDEMRRLILDGRLEEALDLLAKRKQLL